MSERYSKLFALSENLYASGSPVVIAAGALLKDNQTDRVIAQLKLRSISKKTIKAAKVCIFPLDTVGKPLGDTVYHQYLDLSAKRNEDFGQKAAIILPDAATRSFAAAVEEIVFADNTMWKATGELWKAIHAPVTLIESLKDSELVKQYRIQYGADCKYKPTVQNDLWHCTCGELNHKEETVCHRCSKSLVALQAIDIATLKTDRDVRVAIEKQKAAENRAAADAKAKKTKKLVIIIAPIMIAAIMAAILFYNNGKKKQEEAARLETYKTALAIAEEGQYDDAINLLTELGDYKDSAEQLAIIKTEKANAEAYNAAVSQYDYFSLKDITETVFIDGDITGEYYHGGKVSVYDYNNLIDSFAKLGDYKDSQERADEIQSWVDLVVEIYSISTNTKKLSDGRYYFSNEGLTDAIELIEGYKITHTFFPYTSFFENILTLSPYCGEWNLVSGEMPDWLLARKGYTNKLENFTPEFIIAPYTWEEKDKNCADMYVIVGETDFWVNTNDLEENSSHPLEFEYGDFLAEKVFATCSLKDENTLYIEIQHEKSDYAPNEFIVRSGTVTFERKPAD